WTDVTRLGLEVQRPATCLVTGARLDHDPARLFRARRPAEQAPVEIRERVGVRRVDIGPGHGQPGHGTGLPRSAAGRLLGHTGSISITVRMRWASRNAMKPRIQCVLAP